MGHNYIGRVCAMAFAMAIIIWAITKGVNIFSGHSGIWHLRYAHLAHYHMPQNTYCDPWGCVGV